MQSQAQAQKGGLAGAVGTQQSQNAARLNAQSNIVNGDLAILVNLGKLVRFDDQIFGTLGHEAPSSIGQ
jgi:hypothetical protein